jgi:hypothetical protein
MDNEQLNQKARELVKQVRYKEWEQNKSLGSSAVELAKRTVLAEQERDALKAAISWALGEFDDFPERKEDEGAYWWRNELRRRALAAKDPQERP